MAIHFDNTSAVRESATYYVELKELMSELSQRATFNPWATQTSNAVYLLARYGGRWHHLNASAATNELDRVLTLARTHHMWPTLGEPDANLALPLVQGTYRDVRSRWDLLVTSGLFRTLDGLTHVAVETAADRRTFECGTTVLVDETTLVQAYDRAHSWCDPCADRLVQPIGPELDWDVREDATLSS